MGCGGSKFVPDEEEGASGVRPLRKRILEIRRIRNPRVIKDNTLSNKQLLEDAVEDEDNSTVDFLHEDGRKSVSNPEESIGCLKGPSDETVAEFDGAAVDNPFSKMDVVEEKDEEKEVVVVVLKEEVVEEMGEEDDDDDQEVEVVREDEDEGDDEDEDEEDEGAEFCPGSPSFRVYYVASLANAVDCDSVDTSKDDCKSNGEKGENKSRRNESITSLNSSEGSVTILVKKGKKGRRFRRVLPKGGPVAVKNFLNVKSCYNPPCASSHEKRTVSV